MSDHQIRPVLAGYRALVVGVANDQSIAYGCAKAFRTAGAELAITWLNDKARRFVEPLAQELEASITAPLDVSVPGQLEAVFDTIRSSGESLISWSTRSPSRQGRICRASFSTARQRDSQRRWTSRAIRSSPWRSWGRR